MSGSESSYISNESLGFSDQEVNEFMASTSSAGMNASLLKTAQKRVGYSDGKTEFLGYTDGLTKSTVNAFNAWKANRDRADKEHEEYVKLSRQKPGRAGTIIVPTTPDENPTLLGSASSRKTLLG